MTPGRTGAPLEACRGKPFPAASAPLRSVPAPGRLRGSFPVGEGAADTWRPSRREPSRRQPARPGGSRHSCPAPGTYLWGGAALARRPPEEGGARGEEELLGLFLLQAAVPAAHAAGLGHRRRRGLTGGAGAGRRRAPSRPPHGAPPLPLLAQPAGSGAQEEEEEPRLWRPRSRPRSAPFLLREFPGSAAPPARTAGEGWGRLLPGPRPEGAHGPARGGRVLTVWRSGAGTSMLITSNEAAEGDLAEVRRSQTFP